MAKEVIVVPMQYKLEGFHTGHMKLLDYARTINDTNIVVLPRTIDYQLYFLGRKENLAIPKPLKRMGQDVSAMNLKMHLANYPTLPQWKRTDMWNSFSKLIEQYSDILPSTYLRQRCLIYLLGAYHPVSYEGVKEKNWKIAVRGPEPQVFFASIIRPLFRLTKPVIMPEIVKDPIYSIKAQDSINKLSDIQKESLTRIPYVLKGAFKHAKVGANLELAKEITVSYNSLWKLEDLVILEGKLLPGRMEYALFSFRSETGGTQLIEDMTYYV